MNYLPDARSHGAEIYTGVSVRHLQQSGERWLVHYLHSARGEASTVSADIVVLAAGSLGSTEILLRCGQNGLPLSAALGSHFSATGDMVGFAYNADQIIRGVGLGDGSLEEAASVGPCSSGIIDARKDRDLNDGMIMVDGAIPGAASAFLPSLLAATARLTGVDSDAGLLDRIKEKTREVQSKLLGAYVGAIRNTLTCLVVAQDDASGRMYLDDDRLRIRWPGLGDQPQFKRAGIERATRALGGTYVPNPVWNELTDHNLVTGHPLGGCPMADDVQDGVVNHKGQVYSGESGTAVHQGLYVVDATVIPRSLGVNPLLTISALAERSCLLLAGDYGWNIDYALP
jgi:cholesterol oxidase